MVKEACMILGLGSIKTRFTPWREDVLLAARYTRWVISKICTGARHVSSGTELWIQILLAPALLSFPALLSSKTFKNIMYFSTTAKFHFMDPSSHYRKHWQKRSFYCMLRNAFQTQKWIRPSRRPLYLRIPHLPSTLDIVHSKSPWRQYHVFLPMAKRLGYFKIEADSFYMCGSFQKVLQKPYGERMWSVGLSHSDHWAKGHAIKHFGALPRLAVEV
jgi:hypothetical protein